MENENSLNQVNSFDTSFYFYLFIGIIIIIGISYKYDVLNKVNEYIENMKTSSSLYLEQKIKESIMQNGILKNTYFPENSIFKKILESFGFSNYDI
jgi:hypothetical protein